MWELLVQRKHQFTVTADSSHARGHPGHCSGYRDKAGNGLSDKELQILEDSTWHRVGIQNHTVSEWMNAWRGMYSKLWSILTKSPRPFSCAVTDVQEPLSRRECVCIWGAGVGEWSGMGWGRERPWVQMGLKKPGTGQVRQDIPALSTQGLCFLTARGA